MLGLSFLLRRNDKFAYFFNLQSKKEIKMADLLKIGNRNSKYKTIAE